MIVHFAKDLRHYYLEFALFEYRVACGMATEYRLSFSSIFTAPTLKSLVISGAIISGRIKFILKFSPGISYQSQVFQSELQHYHQNRLETSL